MKFLIKTLGCKVNQVESAYIFEKLIEKGFIPAENEKVGELFIINSCAVTERAFRDVKKILKKFINYKPRAVILTGCAASVYTEELKNLAISLKIPHFLILGQNEKFEVEKYLEKLETLPEIYEEINSDLTICHPFLLKEFHWHSRAFVKIQDGCSSYCSYCIVPFTRGPSRSLPEEHILKQIKLYLSQGYEEIVLTGIHLGMWGEDLKPRGNFTELLFKIEEELRKWGKPLHLRLSSLEVNEIDKDFLSFAKESKFLCHHFHIPLQSGSNTILKKMNRRYTREDYLEKLNQIFELFSHATFGADVLVGFPGEGEREFFETCEIIEKSPLNWLHVFPFSPRPNTPAERMKERVPKEKIKERVSYLRNLHFQKRKDFLSKNLGSIRSAVLERETEKGFTGLTDNYINVWIDLKEKSSNPNLFAKKVIKVKLKEILKDFVRAELV